MKRGPARDVPSEDSSSSNPALTRQLLLGTQQALHVALRAARSRSVRDGIGHIATALRLNRVDDALRRIDREWRCLPDDCAREIVEGWAGLYGRLLLLEGHDDAAALSLLERLTAPDADSAALRVIALVRLDRGADARAALAAALQDYCVLPDGLLATAALRVLEHTDTGAPGWLGRNAELDFIGQLRGDDAASAVKIHLDTGESFLQPLRLSTDGQRAFQFKLPAASSGARVEATIHGVPLLGSGASQLPDFGLDGRTSSDNRRVFGWVRLRWCGTVPLPLKLENDAGRGVEVLCSEPFALALRRRFSIDRPRLKGFGPRLHLRARLPDGTWAELPDSPLLLEGAIGVRGPRGVSRVTPRDASPRGSPGNPRGNRLGRWRESPVGRHVHLGWVDPPARRGVTPRRAGIDILIPVHGSPRETLACIEAALDTAGNARIIVIDDASPERELVSALDELEAAGRIQLLRNTVNLGFVASVNRALGLQRRRDAVILNSDAVVFGDWLQRLSAAAYRYPEVGTVTPFTNSGSIASYPGSAERPVSVADAEALDRLAATTHAGECADLPVGVGFCLYVRRDCHNEVGALDASVFGRGYGEETDFCLRARRLGWRHRLAADVFVLHAGGMSFGARRDALLHRSQRLLNLRHPGYDRWIAGYIKQDPLRPLRRRLDEARLAEVRGQWVLLVSLALPGGVARYVNERAAALAAQGLKPLILRPTGLGDRRRCELVTDVLDVPNLVYDIPSELDGLTALLRSLNLHGIEVQHFLHLHPTVIESVRGLDVPYDVVIHDYAWICPRVTLIDGSGRYCGEPAVTVCESCVRRNGSNLKERLSVAALRRRSATWLGGARRVFAPSADTAHRMQRYVETPVEIQPHVSWGAASAETSAQASAQAPAPGLATAPRSAWPAPAASHAAPAKTSSTAVAPPARKARKTKLRIALLGAIGDHKGYQVLLKCARDARRRRLPLEFTVIGHTEADAPLLAVGNVFVTGRYGPGEAAHLLRRERADVIFLASVWPETWSYTLDEALNAGLPIVAFDLGAIAERLRALGRGTLLPFEATPRGINDILVKHSADTAPVDGLNREIMAQPEEHYMKNPPVAAAPAIDALSASVQILPLSAGLYLFSVKSADAGSSSAGQLRLPALHVGLGPGVRGNQVEFIAGPSTEGAWLFAKEDCLVTKVNGSGATLVLTSVRGPGGETLAIKIERLDARADAPSTALPAAALPGTTGTLGAAARPPALPSPPPLASTLPPAVRTPTAVPVSAAAGLSSATDAAPVPVSISTHIRSRGDLLFRDVAWAGRVAPGLWIESFCVLPLARFAAGDIEYKGLTGSGFETPWLTDGAMCGTKGMAVPLVGFAIRLKPGKDTGAFDCEYSGYFKSGVIVGPMRNGAPCRSTTANDPLEGLQVLIRRRAPAAVPVDHALSKTPKAAAPTGPSFGRYRDGHGTGVVAASKAGNGSAATPVAAPAATPSARKPTASTSITGKPKPTKPLANRSATVKSVLPTSHDGNAATVKPGIGKSAAAGTESRGKPAGAAAKSSRAPRSSPRRP